MICTACGALFGYAANADVLRTGAFGLGIGLILMCLVAGATWDVTADKKD